MKKIVLLCLMLAVVFISASYAVACHSDMDCGVGGKCIKSDTDMDGACTNPYGNTEKRGQDTYYEDSSPKSDRSKAGKQCYSNMDCGIGGDCIKVNNSMYGTCTD